MNRIKQIYFFLFLLMQVFCLQAQEEQRPLIEVRSQVDTSVITIGDRILYSIIIDREKELRIERPGEGLHLGMFEIKDYDFHDPEEYDGRIREQFDFSISVYDTGRFVIPAFPVAYFPSDTSQKFLLMEASAIEIFVNSVLSAEGENELKDIKPPLEIPFDYWFWISIAAVFLLLVTIGYIGYRLWKKRKEQGYLFSPPPPPIPPHIKALEDLQKLFDSELIEQHQYKEYFIRLSDIMRIYLEGRYEISALEETTMEILRDIEKYIDDKDLKDQLLQILSVSDLVKFAKHHPDKETIDQTNQSCVIFVERTRPIFIIDEENNTSEAVAAENQIVEPVSEDEKIQTIKTEE